MIPKNIQEMVLEALSGYNDGWIKENYLNQLREIKEFIEFVLEKINNDFEYCI